MEVNQKHKIFISGVDSKLGFHIVQHLRDDHLHLQNSSQFVGSYSHSESPHRHPCIHGIASFTHNRVLLAKYVLDCDVAILDLRTVDDEHEFIVRLLAERGRDGGKGVAVVSIGSYMTWAHGRAVPAKRESTRHAHKQIDIRVLGTITETDRHSRFPHHSWIRNHELEVSLLQLNAYPNIKAGILTPGLVYGRDVPSPQLEHLVAQSLDIRSEMEIYGQGDNLVPMCHVDDLTHSLQFYMGALKKGQAPEILICVDQEPCSQSEIITELLGFSGYVKQLTKVPVNQFDQHQLILSQSLHLIRSPLLPALKCQSSFPFYYRHGYDDICSHLHFTPEHYILYSPDLDPEYLAYLTRTLPTVLQVFTQAHITEELCVGRGVAREEVDIHEISSLIEERYLRPHDRQHYLLVVDQILLDTGVVKQYGLVKYDQALHEDRLIGHVRHREAQEQREAEEQREEAGLDNLRASEVLVQMQQTARTNQGQSLALSHKAKPRNKQLMKMDQYLQDNVIGFVAEAYARVDSNPTLPDFIDALRQIYQRESKLQQLT